MNDRSIIEWLESPSGERWSRHAHNGGGYQTHLMMIKGDTDYSLWNILHIRGVRLNIDPEIQHIAQD